jgi:hypothetical protein
MKVKTSRSDKESYLYGKALERKTPPVAAATSGASSVSKPRLLLDLEQVPNRLEAPNVIKQTATI